MPKGEAPFAVGRVAPPWPRVPSSYRNAFLLRYRRPRDFNWRSRAQRSISDSWTNSTVEPSRSSPAAIRKRCAAARCCTTATSGPAVSGLLWRGRGNQLRRARSPTTDGSAKGLHMGMSRAKTLASHIPFANGVIPQLATG